MKVNFRYVRLLYKEMNNGIYSKSPKITIDEVRSLSKLEGQALANKQQRDQELEGLFVKTNVVCWWLALFTSDNEEAVLEYAKRLVKTSDSQRSRLYGHASTAKPRTNGDGYKGLIFTNQNAKEAPSLINNQAQFATCAIRHFWNRRTTADDVISKNLPW